MGQAADCHLYLLLAAFGREGCLEGQILIGMNLNTAIANRRRRKGEGILRIAAVKHDAAGLCNYLRDVANNILHTIYAWVDGRLTDARSPRDHVTRIADAFEGNAVAFDNHLADTATKQVAILIDIANHDLRRRQDDTVIIAVIVSLIKPVEDIRLDLLHLRLLLMDLFQILLHAALEFLKQLFPIIKYISHINFYQ